MSERDPLPALRGLIDEPIAPRTAFADELRARLLAELGSHRPAAIDEERTMEITTPGLQLVFPGDRARQLPSWRRIAEIAALIVLVFGVIAVFASERVGSPTNPPPTSQGNLGIYPQSFATPEPAGDTGSDEAKLLWEVPTLDSTDGSGVSILVDSVVQNGVAYFLEQWGDLYAIDATSGDLLWTVEVGQNWGIAVDETGVYVTAGFPDIDGSTYLLRLDRETGEELWRVALGNAMSSQPMLYHGIAYAWDMADKLFAVDTQTGTLVWQRSADNPPAASASSRMMTGVSGPNTILDGESIYLVTSDGKFSRIDLANAENGEWAWQFQLDQSVDSPLYYRIAVIGDVVGIVSNSSESLDSAIDNPEGQFTILNRNTGNERWHAPSGNYGLLISTKTQFIVTTEDPTESSTPAAESAASFPYSVTAFNATSGNIDWTSADVVAVAASGDGSLLLGSFGETVESFKVVVMDSSTGEQVGELSSSMNIISPFGVVDSSFYGLQLDGDIAGIDLSEFIPSTSPQETDTALLWQTKPEGEVRGVGKEVISNGTVFRLITTSDFRGVEAFDTANGALLWRQAVVGDDLVADENGVYVTTETYLNSEMSIPTSPEATILGPTDTSIVALDPTTGIELWTADTGTGEAYPTLRDGTLYVLESDWDFNVPRGTTQEVSAIDTGDGTILWTQTIGAPIGRNTINSFTQLRPTKLIAGESTLVAFTSRGTIVTMNRSTGETLWTLDGFHSGSTSFAATDSTLVVATDSSSRVDIVAPGFPDLHVKSAVLAYDITTGDSLWAIDTGGIVSNVVVANGVAITKVFPTVLRADTDSQATPVGQFSETSFQIVGIDIATGEVAWQGIGGDGDRGNIYLVPSADEGSVILVDNRATSYFVIESATGSVSQSPLHFGQPIQGAPVADSQRVYIQLEDGTIAAAALSVPAPQLSEDEVADLLPDTGNPLPASVIWHVDQDVAWPPDAFGLPLGGMAVSDGIVYRAVAGFSFESEETAIAGIEAYDASSGELLWQTPLHFMSIGNTSGDSITSGDGAVYVVANISADVNGPPTRKALIALDGKSGDERWRIEFEDDSGVTGPDYDPTQDPAIETMTYNDGVLYVANSSAVVTAFDAQTGDELWKSDAPTNRTMMSQATVVTEGSITEVQGDATEGSQLSITVSGDRIFVVTQSGSVVALDAATGEFSGEAIPSSTGNTTAPVLIGNLLIVGNTVWDSTDDGFQVGKSGTLTAFDISNNYAIVWEKQVGLSADNVLAIDDALFVTTMISEQRDSVVQRIDPATGDALWSTGNLGQFLSLRNSIGPDGSFVVSSFYEGTVTTLDPESGKIFAISDYLPAVAIEPGDNGLFFATLLDGTLVAINPTATASLGASTEEIPVVMGATPETVATSEATATPEGLLWMSTPASGEFEASSAVFAGNVVVRALKTSDFYGIEGLNTLSGERLWKIDMAWTGAPVSDGRVVYIPADASESEAGAVYAVDPLTGNIRWETTFGGRVVATPNLQIDGLYVMSSNDMVTVLDPISGNKRWESAMDSSTFTLAQFPDLRTPVVASNIVVAISKSGTLYAFDRYSGDELWSKPGYNAATARFAGIADVLVVVDGVNSVATPEAEIDPALPMRIERVDLLTGETLWTLPALLTLPDQPIIQVSPDSIGTRIYVLVEHVLTAGGLYDENGFHPGGTPTASAPGSTDEGTLITIQASSGNVASLQFDQQFEYGSLGVGTNNALLTWPHRTPTNNGQEIDLGQPVYGAPITDDQIFLITLQDGTLVALDANATRGG